MKVGLYFGSFNPVHNGHIAIAHFFEKKALFDQIWLVISPNNPLKEKIVLADEKHRLNMVKLAIQNIPFLHACDIEFSLPVPSFTGTTLHCLENQYPTYQFSLILGADNMEYFHLWKNYEEILMKYKIYVYPRNGNSSSKVIEHQNIIYLNAPLFDVSATEIRKLLKQGDSAGKLLPYLVNRYIEENNVY
ncbi:MAG: nicotinate-nucleotide adenylyltransferase [Bacteroidales bacterium]|jgi:nicotinate-nucleotide adenylyltransferase|nr:nicotinate-nucleotide adenylyltransferase [Bacteroidales bacterium]